jgi:hypothetical protein
LSFFINKNQFFLFIFCILIILHLVYLSSFVLSLFLYNIFLVFPLFYPYTFFWTKMLFFIFYTLSIYHSILGLFILFFLFLFYIYIFFFLYSFFFFWKNIIQKLRKWCFIIAITTLFHYFATLKINMRSYMFLLTIIIFIIVYYR